MAAYVELQMEQGATFNNTVNLLDKDTNSYLDITGYTFKSQMKESPYSSNVIATLVCSISNTANGGLTFGLDAANTSNISGGRYSFDLIAVDTYDTTTRLFEGLIFVDPRVTQ